MIPKTLHYIWLGNGNKPNLTNICIHSWYEKLEGYTIQEWSEANLDLDKIAEENRFFRECRKRKIWAFMADYLRLYILYQYGGIYVDTDIQVLKNFDDILDNGFVVGYEYAPMWGADAQVVGAGVIAAEKGNPTLKKILDFYNSEIWEVDFYTIPMILDYVLKKCDSREYTLYPVDYFAPFTPLNNLSIAQQKERLTENTICIHWYNGSWLDNLDVRLFLKCKHIKNPLLKKMVQIRQLTGYFYRKVVKRK